jgi:hypothetical protein
MKGVAYHPSVRNGLDRKLCNWCTCFLGLQLRSHINPRDFHVLAKSNCLALLLNRTSRVPSLHRLRLPLPWEVHRFYRDVCLDFVC